ncbi:MAG TPA: hypothetical protein PKY28_08145 [Ferruginibacter sp.]|nr:hypothetical protein [Ferruginibacter sp.]
MKHIIKLFMLLSIIAVTNSCKKNDFIPVAKNVYIAGTVSNGTVAVATYWKNGVATHLTDGTKGAIAYAIAVSGNDVYVGGIEQDAPSGNAIIKYWKNGIPTTLSMGLLAEFGSMTVVGNDVYVCGNEIDNTKHVAKYWKNGVETKLTDGTNHANAYAIAVSGNDVYVVGSDGVSGARLWKNGTAINLTGLRGPYSIAVAGNDVYVGCNQLIGTTEVAVYWKNGQVVPLSDGNRDARLRSIVVDNNGVVHATGHESDPVSVPVPKYAVGKYWNSKGASVNLSNATDWNWVNPYAIAVYGNDVFIAGYEVDGINGYNYIITKFWKNGVETDIGNKTSGVVSTGRGIFVTQ